MTGPHPMPTRRNGQKPRQYRRSTPVGRLRRNAAKIARHASLIQIRLIMWGMVADDRVAEILNKVSRILSLFTEVDGILEGLEKSGFVPPLKSGSTTYMVGQHVMIAPKARPKYAAVFAKILPQDPFLLDDLTVSDLLPSGEVVVQRKSKLPFMVPKSHLLPVKLQAAYGKVH